MAARIFLGLSALLWLVFGIGYFFAPQLLGQEEYAGVVATTATGSAEIRAMYGGLEAAIGVMAALALFRSDLVRPALLTIAFLTTGLALARLLGAVMDGGFSSYTWGGLAFEIASAAVAWTLLSRGAPEPAPA
jgi:hypothetical protein